jgi:CHD5-like protein
MFWIPKDWLPYYGEWVLGFPAAPLCSVSTQLWVRGVRNRDWGSGRGFAGRVALRSSDWREKEGKDWRTSARGEERRIKQRTFALR